MLIMQIIYMQLYSTVRDQLIFIQCLVQLTVETRDFLNILHAVHPKLIRAAVLEIGQWRALRPCRVHTAYLLQNSIK
jgi:hypothetical protein